MNKKQKLAIVKSIMVAIVGFIPISIITTLNPIITNKMAMLQFDNSDSKYLMYKFYTENCGTANMLILFVIFVIIGTIIIKSFND